MFSRPILPTLTLSTVANCGGSGSPVGSAAAGVFGFGDAAGDVGRLSGLARSWLIKASALAAPLGLESLWRGQQFRGGRHRAEIEHPAAGVVGIRPEISRVRPHASDSGTTGEVVILPGARA